MVLWEGFNPKIVTRSCGWAAHHRFWPLRCLALRARFGRRNFGGAQVPGGWREHLCLRPRSQAQPIWGLFRLRSLGRKWRVGSRERVARWRLDKRFRMLLGTPNKSVGTKPTNLSDGNRHQLSPAPEVCCRPYWRSGKTSSSAPTAASTVIAFLRPPRGSCFTDCWQYFRRSRRLFPATDCLP